MATNSQKTPWTAGVWRATVHGAAKEPGPTQWLNNRRWQICTNVRGTSVSPDRLSRTETRVWSFLSTVLRVCVQSLRPVGLRGLQPTRLCQWNFPGKNTGVGCHFLLQGIFPTQGLNQHLLRFLPWQVDSLPLPISTYKWIQFWLHLKNFFKLWKYDNTLQETGKIQNKVTYSFTTYYDY